MNLLKNFNLLVKFLLELAMLAAFAYWGGSLDTALPLQITVAIAAPLAVAVIWGLLMAPRAKNRLTGFAFHAVEVLLFVLAFAALAVSGQLVLGLIFVAVYVINKVLIAAWKQ